MPDDWKVVQLIDATKGFFEKRGIGGTARLDAELLLAHVLGCGRIDLYVRFGETVREPKLSEFRDLVRQRGEGRPVKQILGRCEFMSHEFEVTADVLIPRPETETVAEQALARIDGEARTVVDVGTGCGNIAVSIALARPNVTVFATEISAAALEVAHRNAARHGVAGRVTLLGGDLLEPLSGRGLEGRTDCIVSNPPYVSKAEFAGLPAEVGRCEPRVALVSDEEGAGHSRRLVAAAPGYLRTGGVLVMEMSAYGSERVKAAARANPAYDQVSTAFDLGKVERVLILRRGS